jgi:type VI secretion system secreted protein Hcp
VSNDIYLRIEGIKGESGDDTHKDWIECKSVMWDMNQLKSATASTGGGYTAERVEHGDIVIQKLTDLASPILMQTCSAGRVIPRVKIEFMRADGQGCRVKYFEIEITNVIIASVSPAAHEGDLLREYISLKYAKVVWRYTQQRTSGGASGNTMGGWDLSANRITA